VFYRTSASVDADIIHVDNSWVSSNSPAKAGEILIVWATGIGKLSQLATTGAASPGSPPAQAVDLPTVTVGGAAAVVQFAGLAPGLVGLVQINIQLPSTLPAGASLPLVVTFPGGAASQPVSLWVQSSATGPVRWAAPTWPTEAAGRTTICPSFQPVPARTLSLSFPRPCRILA
jgi:uncharacterized protein (TIGR03437 family)